LSSILNQIGFFLNLLSILILIFGSSLYFFKKSKVSSIYIYILVLLLFEIASRILGYLFKSNYLILSFSFFIHFLFLTYFYFSKIYRVNKLKKYSVIGLGLIILIISNYIQPYDRFIYSLTITCYSLFYVYIWLKGNLRTDIRHNLLNGSILLFFCIDAFLAIGTEYLITNSLELVSWFWFFRAILLQLFYITLVYFVWKTQKV